MPSASRFGLIFLAGVVLATAADLAVATTAAVTTRAGGLGSTGSASLAVPIAPYLLPACRARTEFESREDSLDQRALLHLIAGELPAARRLYRAGLACVSERDHPAGVRSRMGLATVDLNAGAFSTAEAEFRACLQILSRDLDSDGSLLAQAASGLGLCCAVRGDYIAAETVLRESLAAVTSVAGESNGPAGSLILGLADVLSMLGRHAEASRHFRRAAGIMESVYGPDSAPYAVAISGLAHTLRWLGDSQRAAALYRRAIAIVDGDDRTHPIAIQFHSRLGMSLAESGDRTAGLASVEQAIRDAREIYGRGSYQSALAERHLGLVLVAEHRWEEAITVLERSLAVLERCFGPSHPYLAPCLKGLARVFQNMGRIDLALDWARRAVATHEPALARDRMELAHLLRQQADIELDARRWNEAAATAIRAAEIALAVQAEGFLLASTREAILHTRLPWSLSRLMVTAVEMNPQPATLGRVFSLVNRSHGQALDWLARRRRFLSRIGDSSQLDKLRRELLATTGRVVDLSLNPPSPGGDAVRANSLDSAHREMERADRSLSAFLEALSARAGDGDRDRESSTVELAAALPPGATLLHFIRYPKWVAPSDGGRRWRRSHYGVFHLRAPPADRPALGFVDLGAARSLDSLVHAYRRNIDAVRPGRRPSVRAEAEYRKLARALYDRLWAPLFDGGPINGDAAVDPAPLVLLVPDSRLHYLDFNTLLSPAGELVIEGWRVHLLSSGGDLLRLSAEHATGSGLLAVGNPTVAASGTNNGETGDAPVPGAVGSRNSRATALATPLPGAEAEARAVAALFAAASGEEVVVLLGADAGEGSVKRLLTGRRMAHLAAHGFHGGDDPPGGRSLAEQIGGDPLLESGLVLAPDSEGEDGLLTAREIACLDLQGLDWVVLSACGSGLGRLIAKEGLFGPRRAFEIAGARTVLMALWRVDDRAGRELMERIYRHRLAGRATVDAVREAQLEGLRDVSRRYKRLHPVLWGGIVAEGDWR